jgi:hypothetical protein
LILAEFSVIVPMRLRWGRSEQLVVSEALPAYPC